MSTGARELAHFWCCKAGRCTGEGGDDAPHTSYCHGLADDIEAHDAAIAAEARAPQAEDLREANDNIERMKAGWFELDAKLTAMTEERDDWRKQRVDVGLRLNLWQARHEKELADAAAEARAGALREAEAIAAGLASELWLRGTLVGESSTARWIADRIAALTAEPSPAIAEVPKSWTEADVRAEAWQDVIDLLQGEGGDVLGCISTLEDWIARGSSTVPAAPAAIPVRDDSTNVKPARPDLYPSHAPKSPRSIVCQPWCEHPQHAGAATPIAVLPPETQESRRFRIEPQPTKANSNTGPMWTHRHLAGHFAEHVFGSCLAKMVDCEHAKAGDKVEVQRVGGVWFWVVTPASPPMGAPAARCPCVSGMHLGHGCQASPVAGGMCSFCHGGHVATNRPSSPTVEPVPLETPLGTWAVQSVATGKYEEVVRPLPVEDWDCARCGRVMTHGERDICHQCRADEGSTTPKRTP